MHEHDGAIYVNAREWRILEGGGGMYGRRVGG